MWWASDAWNPIPSDDTMEVQYGVGSTQDKTNTRDEKKCYGGKRSRSFISPSHGNRTNNLDPTFSVLPQSRKETIPIARDISISLRPSPAFFG